MTALTMDSWIITPADSARAAADVYSISLLILVPLAVACVAAICLRTAPAHARALVWRSVVIALAVVYAGAQLPVQLMAWVLPGGLAEPLILLGRTQVSAAGQLLFANSDGATANPLSPFARMSLAQLIILTYWAGAALVLLRTATGLWRARQRARGATILRDPRWQESLAAARIALGIRRGVRMLVTANNAVPATWGFFRPVILVPSAALTWPAAHRDALLLHELAHVRANDWALGLLARAVCALYWFHPGAWWAARRLRGECEHASDDTVLALGVRSSDYAELLANAAAAFRVQEGVCSAGAAVAMAHGYGLRRRLELVLSPRAPRLSPARAWVAAAVVLTCAVSAPLSTVRLVPTRGVLTTLMNDSRWQSRAYAVLGLAQRSDSLALAQAAAAADPSPQVRAWARRALGERTGRPAVPPERAEGER